MTDSTIFICFCTDCNFFLKYYPIIYQITLKTTLAILTGRKDVVRIKLFGPGKPEN